MCISCKTAKLFSYLASAKMDQNLIISFLLLACPVSGLAPQGCSYSNGVASCDFRQWIPPLQDNDFNPLPVTDLRLKNINGTIPDKAFSGLNIKPAHGDTEAYLTLYCNADKTSLTREIFTQNLQLVTDLTIYGCYLENGLSSRLLENLRRLKYLTISGSGSGIDGLVAHDALAGLSNLLKIYIRASITGDRFPDGFFDGLSRLTEINLRLTGLNFIPPNWLNGLVSLEKIYLSSNNLQTLPVGLFSDLGSLTFAALQDNPWHCSCELTWLLYWSHIIDGFGVVCNDPTMVINATLETAYGLLKCNQSTPSILSTSISPTTEVPGTHTSLVAGVWSSIVATFPKSLWISLTSTSAEIFTTSLTTTTIATIRTHHSTPQTAAAALAIPTTTALPISAASWSDLTPDGMRSIKVSSSQSSGKHSLRTNVDAVGSNLRNIILIATVGTLSVLSVVVTCLFWNKCVGRLNRVNRAGTGRAD